MPATRQQDVVLKALICYAEMLLEYLRKAEWAPDEMARETHLFAAAQTVDSISNRVGALHRAAFEKRWTTGCICGQGVYHRCPVHGKLDPEDIGPNFEREEC